MNLCELRRAANDPQGYQRSASASITTVVQWIYRWLFGMQRTLELKRLVYTF